MRKSFYLLVLTLPAATMVGLVFGGAFTWVAPLYAFGLIPLLDVLLGGDEINPTQSQESDRRSDRVYDRLLFAVVPVQVGVMGYFVWRVGQGAYAGAELAGAIIDAGLCCGGLAINVAHELGHRSQKLHQNLAKVLLASTLYMHFFIEHNRGHHARVATEEDPASSRRGELVYTFWLRSLVGGWISAWKLEATLARKRGRRVLSWRNQMLRFQLVQLALLVAVGLLAGPVALAAFIAAGLFGALLLETINYVEHYGLRREKTASGRYEKVLPAHSWNANHHVSRALLFELSRHSDHHANPKRPYPLLRHFDESPQLPTGYSGMVLLALVPPLFFALMHPRLEALAA